MLHSVLELEAGEKKFPILIALSSIYVSSTYIKSKHEVVKAKRAVDEINQLNLKEKHMLFILAFMFYGFFLASNGLGLKNS